MVYEHAIKEMDIILSEGAQIEKLVDVGVLQRELTKTLSMSDRLSYSVPLTRLTSHLLYFILFDFRGHETIGPEVFANGGRIGSIIMSVPYAN